MSNDAAELSSLSATLEDLTRRITTIAERRNHEDRTDDAAVALFSVERSLREAHRRLEKLVRSLQSRV